MNCISHKYTIPTLPKMQIKSNAKLKLFFTSDKAQIIYIQAPTGYGKTTQMLLLIKNIRMNASWLTLDMYDSSIENFCKDFVLSLANAFKINNHMIDFIHTPTFLSMPLESLRELLISLSTKDIPDIIVLDNFHLCQNREIATATMILYELLPPKKILAILSRSEPPAIFAEQILKRNICIVHSDSLRYSLNDLEELFLREHVLLSKDTYKQLYEETDGCIMYILSILDSYKHKKHFAYETLDNYIESSCLDNFDERTKNFLIQCSILDTINSEYCKEVLEFDDCETVFNFISASTGFIKKIDLYYFRYHGILKKYLNRKLLTYSNDVITELYYKAAWWYYNHNEAISALNIVLASKNLSLIYEIISCVGTVDEVDIADYVVCISHYQQGLSTEEKNNIFRSYPRLCIHFAWVCFLDGRLDELERLIDSFFKKGDFISSINTFRTWEEIFIGLLLYAFRSGFSLERVLNIYIEVFNSNSSALTGLNTACNYLPRYLMCNLPFFHKSQQDYCSISSTFLNEYQQTLAHICGKYTKVFYKLLVGGIYYEKNQLKESLESVQDSLDSFNDYSIDVIFSANILLAEILFSKGLNERAGKLLDKTKSMIYEKNGSHLKSNMRAYEIRQLLFSGDRNAAEEWLRDSSDVYVNVPLKFYLCFQNIVTAKALIVTEKFDDAILFLDKLIVFCQNYRRTIDLIETYATRSICYYKKNNVRRAISDIVEALILSQEFSITMPIILLGKDIEQVLQKVINKIHKSPESIALDKTFVNNILLHAKERGKIYKGFFPKLSKDTVKLSAKQKYILGLLSENRSYCEIGEINQIQISTVREHIGRIYHKLEVSNKNDALLKAREIGIIERE